MGGGGVGGTRWNKKLLGYTQLCFFLPEGLDRVHNTLLRLAGVTWPGGHTAPFAGGR